MPNKVWKQAERRAAALFGTTRTPLSGRSSKHGTKSDSLHPELFIEVKWRKQFGVVSLWYTVSEAAAKEKKEPVLALCEKARKKIFAVVPLDFDYLIRLACALKEGQSRGAEEDDPHSA